MTSSPKQHEQNPLKPVLEETEAELKQHLETTRLRTPEDVAEESEGELRELEDSLLAAAVAVQQTISLRRHVEKHDAAATKEREEAQRAESAEKRSSQTGAVREFHDHTGRHWRAWSVTPGLRPGRDAKRYLGEYHGGWLCFEALDGSSRRRLPKYPSDWVDFEEPALENLLEGAVDAPERKTVKPSSAEASDPSG
jgi:hypothetical protein